jgi:hypothetical protein
MKIIAFEKEHSGSSREQFQHHALAEARAAWNLYQAGWIRDLYYLAGQLAAVLVLECESSKVAEGILAELLVVREGWIRFEQVPLKSSPGFERLFEGNDPS